MGQLIYLTPASLDGFLGDGDHEWSVPYAEDVMSAVTQSLAGVGTYLYGRRTYETMAVWETDPAIAGQSPGAAAFAATWRAADKIVFSSRLTQVQTRRTRVERRLTAEQVNASRAASRGDLTVGGATLAAEALRLDLVDVVELLWCPVLLGGGLPVLPAGVRRNLTLRRERRFDSGVVQATYDVVRG
ncbi:dihydrofolate reductase family protein [Pseudonocardia sp. HH130630-07]|uniref:dihydrofolate reductase family protein n=1 Tax=Pseudonocardia sp. HH130630-07 TaxID=1690815 RepID=UPI00081530EE|nr:dihydrofolate reductase family protein [Pseudonocardia sp. HH130630-07]ANY08464.1 deaminase [Pseudonocardia sp. HH130630-07]